MLTKYVLKQLSFGHSTVQELFGNSSATVQNAQDLHDRIKAVVQHHAALYKIMQHYSAYCRHLAYTHTTGGFICLKFGVEIFAIILHFCFVLFLSLESLCCLLGFEHACMHSLVQEVYFMFTCVI